MPQKTATPISFSRLSIAIASVQVVDILIHAATDQIEPLRVLSNASFCSGSAWLRQVESKAKGCRWLLSPSISS